jgi:hypothetical protein
MAAALEALPEAQEAGLRPTPPPPASATPFANTTVRDVEPPRFTSHVGKAATVASDKFRRASMIISAAGGNAVRWSSQSRRRALLVGAGVGAALVVAVVATRWRGRAAEAPRPPQANVAAPLAGSAQARPPVPAAPEPPAPAPVVPAPEPPEAPPADPPRARPEAPDPIARLRALRRSQPRNATHAAALARLYFERRRFPEALSETRAACALNPKNKRDLTLQRGAIEALGHDPSRKAATALLREIGAPARPQLQQAAKSHPDPRVRSRAAELTRPKERKKKPFLRWM